MHYANRTEVIASPNLLVGDIEQIVGARWHRCEVFGISSATLPEYFMEAA